MKTNDNKTHHTQIHIAVYLPAMLILQAFLLVLYSECVTFSDFSIPWKWVDIHNLFYLFYNTAIYFLFALILFCVTKRLLPGYVVSFLITTLFSVVGNMKWNQLKEGISLADFQKLSEAAQMGNNVEFLAGSRLAVGFILFVILGVLVYVLDRYGKRQRQGEENTFRELMRVCRRATLILLAAFVLFVRWDWSRGAMERITEARTADVTGPAVYFLESVEKVLCEEACSKEEAVQIYQGYAAKGKRLAEMKAQLETDASAKDRETQPPNIIVIMSEAFYDVNQLEGKLHYSSDPMAAYNAVAAEGISGSVATNIYGGSTHYSEFEFLTGWNTRGMSLGSCPYKQYFKGFQPSIVKYLKDAGYSTIAIHPYEKWFWNRKGAYSSMGFDNFIGRNDMKYTKMCGFISDESLTQEIIYRYEQAEGRNTPFFCFSVSMANHIALINDDKKENPPEQIQVDYEKDTPESVLKKRQIIKRHVSGMEKSGEALKALTDYFKTVDEPTVIVFFGDHAPSYAAEVIQAGNMNQETAYKTPFLIWSNYELPGRKNSVTDSLITDEKGEKTLNVSYLSTYLLDVCGMPMPEQGYYNIGLMGEYPVETRYMIWDQNFHRQEQLGKKEEKEYIKRAKDLKNSINTLLENRNLTEGIWD